MPTDGAILRAFIEQGRLRPVRIYTAMEISKQAFYKLYDSKEFEPGTIQRIETAIGKPWAEIKKVNVDDNVTRETPVHHSLATAHQERKISLEKSIENLTENELRTTALLERMMTLLEQQYGNKLMPPPGTEGTETLNPRKIKKSRP